MKLLIRELPKHNVSFIQAMKPLFDSESFLFRCSLCKHIQTISPIYDRKEDFPLIEKSKIDAVYEEKLKSKTFRMWSIATVTSCSDTTVTCKFVGHQELIKIDKKSNRIAPLNTFTTDMSWRDKLKKGSQIDVADPEQKWFQGTILNIEENKVNSTKRYLVAFRVYMKNGTKADESGNFEGWRKDYDELIDAYSTRIQQLNTIVKDGYNYCQYDIDYETQTPEDDEDMLLNV